MVYVFISHSKKDVELVRVIKTNFMSAGITPLFMEFTPESKPPYAKIEENIKNSDAVFLFLTQNIISSKYTENWISFEVGLAKAANKPLFLTEDINNKVHYPVPYVSSYILYEPTKIEDWRTIQQILLNLKRLIENKKFLVGLTVGGAILGGLINKKDRVCGALLGGSYGMVFGGILTALNQATKTYRINVSCPKCKLSFDYYSIFTQFPCPSCRTELTLSHEENAN